MKMWVFCGGLADDIGYDTICVCDKVDGFGDALFVWMMIYSAAMTLSGDGYSQGSMSVSLMLVSRHTLHTLHALVAMGGDVFVSFLDIREIVLRKGFFGILWFWCFIFWGGMLF